MHHFNAQKEHIPLVRLVLLYHRCLRSIPELSVRRIAGTEGDCGHLKRGEDGGGGGGHEGGC